ARLARQIDRPVRWDTTMRALRAAHPDAVYLEVGPGKVLTGLMRAIDPRCRVWRVDGPATLAAAGAAVAAGGDAAPASRERA
ncbi:MAG: hypothetical protein ACREMB_21445, partial [Candidatus Rokuibacteriota bacterium]